VQTTNRIFWKNKHLGYEQKEVRALFRPLSLKALKELQIGSDIWVATLPRKDESILGYVRSKVTELVVDGKAAKVGYRGFYESGEHYVFEKNNEQPMLYILAKTESDLERLASASPSATIPMVDYRPGA
jgi:hypothetical protein